MHKCSDSINSWISQLRSKFGLFFFFCHFCVLYVLFGVVLLLFETILSEVDAQVFRFNKYLDQSIGLLINILIVLSSFVNSVFCVFCLVWVFVVVFNYIIILLTSAAVIFIFTCGKQEAVWIMCEPRKHTHLILHCISLVCIGLLSIALVLCLICPNSDFCLSSVETPSVTEPPANENSCQDKCGWDYLVGNCVLDSY